MDAENLITAEEWQELWADSRHKLNVCMTEYEILLQREAAMTVKLGELVKEMEASGQNNLLVGSYAHSLSALLPLDTEGWIREHDRELLDSVVSKFPRSTVKDVISSAYARHFQEGVNACINSVRALLPAPAGKLEGDAHGQ